MGSPGAPRCDGAPAGVERPGARHPAVHPGRRHDTRGGTLPAEHQEVLRSGPMGHVPVRSTGDSAPRVLRGAVPGPSRGRRRPGGRGSARAAEAVARCRGRGPCRPAPRGRHGWGGAATTSGSPTRFRGPSRARRPRARSGWRPRTAAGAARRDHAGPEPRCSAVRAGIVRARVGHRAPRCPGAGTVPGKGERAGHPLAGNSAPALRSGGPGSWGLRLPVPGGVITAGSGPGGRALPLSRCYV